LRYRETEEKQKREGEDIKIEYETQIVKNRQMKAMRCRGSYEDQEAKQEFKRQDYAKTRNSRYEDEM